MCLNATATHSIAVEFSKKYVQEIVDQTLEHYPSLSLFFEKMFENRMAFYDRIVEKNQDNKNILKILVEEFEIILKSNLINKGYSDFSETSPMPILDFFKDFEYSAEINSFFNNMPKMLAPQLEQVQNHLANKQAKP